MNELKFSTRDKAIVKVPKSNLGVSSLWLGSEDFSSQIDIIVVSDGYLEREMLEFVGDAKRLFENVFAKIPFSEYRQMFNITLVEKPSSMNKFLSNSSFLGIERYVGLQEMWQLHNTINGFPYEHVVVLRKSAEYEGAGIYNHYTIVSSDHPSSADILVHELGHSIFGLADEYVEPNSPLASFYDEVEEPWEPNISKSIYNQKWYNAPSTIRFNRLVDSLGTGISKLSSYEGAGYKDKGIYRPYPYCTMRNASTLFCPVCQDAIIRQIMFQCSLEEEEFDESELFEEEE